MTAEQGAFLITIDTEGDDLWAAPREITTRNAEFLPRFQSLCERFGFQPTWLTNYEMASCPSFQEFGRDVIRRGTGEIGMHLHAWNSPPLVPLTDDDFRYQPYLIEYPAHTIREKIRVLTGLLEGAFERALVSHRAGRWSMNARYAGFLVEQGYRVDCSVTPHVSWRHAMGDPAQSGGTDFSTFPEGPYFPDPAELGRPGDSPLLELPMTILPSRHRSTRAIGGMLGRTSLPGRVWNRLFPAVHWLRPNGRNLAQMREVLARVRREQRTYAQMMLHSSELMPGGSPTFRTRDAIEDLYRDLEQLFADAATRFTGMTLQEFDRRFRAGSSH